MGLHRIKKGLDLPISGAPEQRIEDGRSVRHVAIVAADSIGLKPTLLVAAGDTVRRGQALFEDKRQPGVRYTAPGSGTVAAVHRGAKRALQSVVVRVDAGAKESQVSFSSYRGQHPSSLSRQQVKDLLIESGLWTALRARPFGRVAAVNAVPHSLFVTAVDSQPLAPDLERVLEGRESDLERGMHALAKLTDGPVFLCRRPGSRIATPTGAQFRVEEFRGPHPAGTVGLHIHRLDPVDRHKSVWHLGLQDVLAVGRLFESGELDTNRVVAIGGPQIARPRLLRTRLGAALGDLLDGELAPSPSPAPGAAEQPPRVISGSALSGREAHGEIHGYLGRYHQQVTVLAEDHQRHFLGWMAPGSDRFSATRLFLSRLLPGREFALSTSTQGSPRAIVPIGVYERVVPFDIEPTYLLKSLVMTDIERAEELGCLELDEEDVALCTFVCPGKIDYGKHLRETLDLLEKEG